MAALAFSTGCSSLPWLRQPPLAPPPAKVTVEHFAGNPLSGPLATVPDATSAGESLAVRVSFVAMEQMPSSPSQGVGSLARLIAVERGGVPVLATPRLTEASRLFPVEEVEQFTQKLEAEKPSRAVALATAYGALPAGVTASFEAAEVHAEPWIVAGQAVHRSVKIELYRRAGADAAKKPIEVAMTIEDLVVPSNPADKSDELAGMGDSGQVAKKQPAKPLGEAVLQREMAIFDREVESDKDQFAVVIPFQFGKSAGRVIAILVEISPPDSTPEHLIAVAHCQEEIATAAKLATTRPYRMPVDNPDWASFSIALDSLRGNGAKRAALVFLASQTGAGVCEDAAMVADAATQDALAQRIIQSLGPSPDITKKALAWVLDRAALELMAEQLSTGKLAPELAATLTLHTGEAGRHPGSVEEALRAVNNSQDFDVQLTAENYIFLEDGSPASRVRAFDWLQSHDRAPQGYDPLGSPKQRSAALDKALHPSTLPAGAP